MSQYVWETSQKLVPYHDANNIMEQHVNQIYLNNAPEKIWLLEHPDVYTLGISAKKEDIINTKFPIIQTNRGGKVTYHGPKMRIIYIMLDLKKRKSCDVRQYIYNLEQVIINSLQHFGLIGERRKGRIGIWIKTSKDGEDKIAAIGVRIRKWITFHGISVNIAPDIENYNGIVPCGINNTNYGITSLAKLGINITMKQFDNIFKKEFTKIFPIIL